MNWNSTRLSPHFMAVPAMVLPEIRTPMRHRLHAARSRAPLRPGAGGSSEPSLAQKLFRLAHASISVPSTEKRSSDRNRLTLGRRSTASRNLAATSASSSRSGFFENVERRRRDRRTSGTADYRGEVQQPASYPAATRKSNMLGALKSLVDTGNAAKFGNFEYPGPISRRTISDVPFGM